MDGEFVCEEKVAVVKAIGGGNFLILAQGPARRRWRPPSAPWPRCSKVRNVILPFPGGVVRSGSKVGSKYKTLLASTNDAYCPTLVGLTRLAAARRASAPCWRS